MDEKAMRDRFEAECVAMGFDVTRQSLAVPEPWAEYVCEDTGHRWGGYLSGYDAAAIPQKAEAPDAERFRAAIASEDNADTLFCAVINNAPDTAAIRAEFDAAPKDKP